MQIKYGRYTAVSLIYLTIPVLLMLLGSLRLFIAIPASLVFALCVFFIARYEHKEDANRKPLNISLKLLITAAVVSLLWVFFCGVGEFSWTTADHMFRSAIFNDLIDYSWPVTYDKPEGIVGFVYYYAFWTPAALTGKLAGHTAGRIALLLYTVIGIVLIFIGTSFYGRKASVLGLAILILFSSLDIVPFFIKSSFFDYEGGFEPWNIYLNIHSNTFQLMNVFQQCVPGWLIACLLINGRSSRYVGTLGTLMLFYSPWATIGMIPTALYLLLKDKAPKAIFTLENCLPVLTGGLVLIPYYLSGNNGSSFPSYLLYDSTEDFILAYILYLVFEIAIWYILLFPSRAVNPDDKFERNLLISFLPAFILLPLYKMGGESDDLLLRGTLLPAFVLCMIFTRKAVVAFDNYKKKQTLDAKGLTIVIAVILTFAIPVILLMTSVAGTISMYRENGLFNNPDTEIIGSIGQVNDEYYRDFVAEQFYADSYIDSFFYNYLAKR